MGWWQRVRAANRGARVTLADERRAMDAAAEIQALAARRNRLHRDGLAGTARIVAIREGVAVTALGAWHELTLDVELPGREPYRVVHRVALDLSGASHLAVGATVAVRADPADRTTLVVTDPPR